MECVLKQEYDVIDNERESDFILNLTIPLFSKEKTQFGQLILIVYQALTLNFKKKNVGWFKN